MSASPALPLAQPPEKPEVVGRYRVGEQLAVGGMGTIHVAYDTLARRKVAYKRLKVPNEGARPRLSALFEREYNALRQLKHPNIVEVYDYGFDDEGPYYTMELLSGRDLAAAAPLPLAEAARVLRDVASALALLHARRIVHRDVTPANVRLGADGRAKLLDFGALSEFGPAREVVGTPPFIAPECLSGRPLDARTDLFSLGGLCYWALTRRQAYPARSIGELHEVWALPVPPPSQHVPELSKELDELVLSLLEQDPVARPDSAAYVIERLTALAELPAEQDESQVAFSYLLHPPLVGRDLVLEQLRRFTAEACEGEGRTVMIEGTSGLGRSALLDQLAIEAQLAGASVLRFQPSGDRDGGLTLSIKRWMRALFPDLWSAYALKNPVITRSGVDRRAAETPVELSERRAKLTAAMRSALEEMSQRAPLALLIDDVHRADGESLALLATLARITGRSRILLVVTREEHSAGSDANALSNLRAVSTPIVLRPLIQSDLDAMVDVVFGRVPNGHRLSRFLHAQSGGNPGQCMDVCRILLQEREIRYALGTFALPFDPRATLLEARSLELTRLADMSAETRLLIRLCSLHDGALGVAHAKSALGWNDEQLFGAGEDLLAQNLLRYDEQTLALTSESLRRALRESLTPAERTTLHGALSSALLTHGDGSIENKLSACHHLLRAGREDDAIALIWEPLRVSIIPLESVAPFVPVLEHLLETMKKRGARNEHCWMLLWPLVMAGYWGGLGAAKQHRDVALNALARLTGMALAKRLTPLLGKKLALIIGIVCGIFRMATLPKRFRPPNYPTLVQRFFSGVTMATATSASAFEPDVAMRTAALLDPFEAMKENSPGRVAREFALATAEVGAGLNTRAGERYARILELLAKDRIFDDPHSREGFIDAATHGRAQAEVTQGSPDVLRLADELAQRHPFFGPHVEGIRMTFHGYRGEKELADRHRKQGEMLALQGGLSWSAFTMFSIRSAYIAMTSQDTMGVLQASVDLERVANVAPNALLFRDLCRAYIATVRGQPEDAVKIYERIAASPEAPLPAFELDAALHAEALLRLGRAAAAKKLCEEAIAARRAQGNNQYSLRLTIQQLALAEAKLGDFARAKQRLGELAPEVEKSEAPLPIGALRRDQARIALMERDAAAFDDHFGGMIDAFRTTKNQALILQCRRLLAEAEKSGLIAAPNWEKHELVAPANTQDLASEAPEVTELVETYS